ncbi:MAG: hypothetical protein AB7K24_20170, partial [Gemmataceae bacterium]
MSRKPHTFRDRLGFTLIAWREARLLDAGANFAEKSSLEPRMEQKPGFLARRGFTLAERRE